MVELEEGDGAEPEPIGMPAIGGEGVAARSAVLVESLAAEDTTAIAEDTDVAEGRARVADGVEAAAEDELEPPAALVGAAEEAATLELAAGHITAGVYTGIGSVVP